MLTSLFVVTAVNGCGMYSHLLHHGFRLARRVVRAEVLELFHVFLHRDELALKLVAQRWERVANVVRQLLVECALKERGAHAVRHVSAGRKQRLKGSSRQIQGCRTCDGGTCMKGG